MRRLLLVLSLAAAGPAMAEDFTGFYAGLNAGYATSSPGHAAALALPAGAAAAALASQDLPPSASEAAKGLANRRPAERAPAAR